MNPYVNVYTKITPLRSPPSYSFINNTAYAHNHIFNSIYSNKDYRIQFKHTQNVQSNQNNKNKKTRQTTSYIKYIQTMKTIL